MARRNRRAKLPLDPVETQIESLSHDGRGVARIEGKTVFIDGGLGGERVRFRYSKKHSKYDEGRVVEVLSSSPDRVEAKCQHYGVCGGCSLMHMAPVAQLVLKQKTLMEQMSHFGHIEPEEWIEPMTGPLWGYRRKARLGVKHVPKKNRVLVGFREKGTPYLALLDKCEVLDPRIGTRLAELGSMIETLAAYNRIAQIEVAMDDKNTALVFRNLDPLSDSDQKILITYGQKNDLWIYLQSGGPDTITPIWPKSPQLSYAPEVGLTLMFEPSDFTQVNATINQNMIQLTMELLEVCTEDRVLDLFCGLGNFSLPLARRVSEVVGVEGDAALVKHAQNNAKLNDLNNATFEQADLTKTALKDYSWANDGFNKILLDPPRSGAFEVLSQLARDAGELVHKYGYTLVSAGIMDMFPHTSHVESIALFIKV